MKRSCIQCTPAHQGRKQFSFPIQKDTWEKLVPSQFNENIETNATSSIYRMSRQVALVFSKPQYFLS
jgi:hypothetical protein